MFCEACSVVLSDDENLVIAVRKTVPLDISRTFVELCGSCSCENADGDGVPQIGAAQQESGRTLADAQLEGCFAVSTRRQGATTSSLTDTCAVFVHDAWITSTCRCLSTLDNVATRTKGKQANN